MGTKEKKSNLWVVLTAIGSVGVLLPLAWNAIILLVKLQTMPVQMEAMQAQVNKIDRNVERIAIQSGVEISARPVSKPDPAHPRKVVSKDVEYRREDILTIKN